MNHDQLFKDLLSTYFLEFLELFAPELLTYADRDSLTFVDKEVFADLPAGQRGEADLCARLRFRDEERLFLVHLEHEAQRRGHFGARMFNYFARLHSRYDDCHIYPVALLSFDSPLQVQPDRYIIEFPDFRPLDFRYRVIQLNRLNWRDFLDRPNATAAALMTRMNIDAADRPLVKMECVRILAKLKLDPAKFRFLLSFVDQYLRLTPEETGIFQRQIEQSDMQQEEREVVMTSWELQGHQKGLQEGREQGREQGREEGLQLGLRQAITLMIESRFGPEGQNFLSKIEAVGDADRLTGILAALGKGADLAELQRLLSE